MKKTFTQVLFISILSCLLFCVGCSHDYTLMHEQSEISSIEIVSLPDGLHYKEDLKAEAGLCKIENISAFLTELSEIKFESIHPPYDSSIATTAIKITYQNGDCEWISPHGRTTFKNGSLNFTGSISCDETNFFAWIDGYTNE